MTIPPGQTTPAASEEQHPVPVEIVWTHRENTTLTGFMTLGPLGRTDSADARTHQATGRSDQFLITGGRRRTTLDASNDHNPDDQCRLDRVTPEQAARALADWCGFTGRPVTLRITDETH